MLKCSKCDSDYAEHYFKNDENEREIICEDCIFEMKNVKKEPIGFAYYVDGEYIADTHDYSMYEIAEQIANVLGYTEISDLLEE